MIGYSFFIINNAIISAADRVDFKTNIDINTDPFINESTYNMQGLSLNGSLMLGAQFDWFGMGLEMNDTYFLLIGQNLDRQMNGNWNVLRLTANFYHTLGAIGELQWGAGGAWINGMFNYNLGELFTRNEPGPSLLLNLFLNTPLSFLEIGLLNKFDLYITDKNLFPYYSGSLRLNIHPVIDFISLYMELTGVAWPYKKNDDDLFAGIILINIGFSLKLNLPETFERFADNSALEKERILAKNKAALELLRIAGKDTVIVFNDIRFNKKTVDLHESALPVIAEIAGILKTDNTLVIAIKAYADNLGDPVKELDLIIRRGKVIKKYLVELGIQADRIKILESGNIALLIDPVLDTQDYSNVTVRIIYR